MQVATWARVLAFARQLSKLVKASALLATNVPTRTENTMPMISARTPQMTPATACPELVAPVVFPRVRAMRPRTTATRPPRMPRGKRTNDTAATRLATPTTRAATPRPFLGRADEDVTAGGAG